MQCNHSVLSAANCLCFSVQLTATRYHSLSEKHFIMSAGSIIQKKRYTFQEYLKLEEQEHIRYEYYNGEVFAMAGVSLNHGDIVFNVHASIKSGFSNSGCRSFQESYKLEVLEDKYYVYPDVVLTCDPEDVKADYIIKHPVLIAEIISPSTERYDRTVKWTRYRRLP